MSYDNGVVGKVKGTSMRTTVTATAEVAAKTTAAPTTTIERHRGRDRERERERDVETYNQPQICCPLLSLLVRSCNRARCPCYSLRRVCLDHLSDGCRITSAIGPVRVARKWMYSCSSRCPGSWLSQSLATLPATQDAKVQSTSIRLPTVVRGYLEVQFAVHSQDV